MHKVGDILCINKGMSYGSAGRAQYGTGRAYMSWGVIRNFKIVLFRMLASQYHTDRLAAGGSYSGPGHTAP